MADAMTCKRCHRRAVREGSEFCSAQCETVWMTIHGADFEGYTERCERERREYEARAAAELAAGPPPLPDWMPPCCWGPWWYGGGWGVRELCDRKTCTHEHHQHDLPAMAAAE